jgi:hypothetical protein
MNVIFSPFIFVIIVVSSIFSTPILAIFTLPVFFLAYPRPLRFWPGKDLVWQCCIVVSSLPAE